MSLRNTLSTLAIAGLLAACSGGPSESEINEAVKGQLKGLAGASDAIKEVKKIGCEKSGEAWNCDVQVTAKMFGQESTAVQRMRFVKTDKGWAVSR